MKFDVYHSEFKGNFFLTIASDNFIMNKLELNNREKSDLEIHLQKDDPDDFYDYKFELFDLIKHKFEFYDSISLVETINIDISVFNDKINHLIFGNVNFSKAKIDDNFLSNLCSVKEVFINDFSMGNIFLNKFINLEKLNILNWNTTKTSIINNNSRLIFLVIWYYNPKNKLLSTLLSDVDSIENLEIKHTNIESLEGVEKLKNLKNITIYYGKNLKFVKNLNLCKNLEKVVFFNCKKIEDINLLQCKFNLI
jgi:hypothetical protein